MNPSRSLARSLVKHWEFYALLALPLAWYVIFQYIPMYGVQIAFKDFNPVKGINGSPWVGLKYFQEFFQAYYFSRLIINTLLLSLYNIVFGFPIPILLALLINEIKGTAVKKVLQNITYVPHFLSVVVVAGMAYTFLHQDTGIVNLLLKTLGMEPVAFMQSPGWFRTVFVSTGVWQEAGWAAIIYLAALSGIDPSLYEAAKIDGASRLRRIWHISIPGIAPTIIILFILRIGHVMDIGFEKTLLMQNSLNAESSDIIQTFIYATGIQQARYSFTGAIGLFNSLINFALLIVANRIARWKSDTSLW
ncbi:ABC transporter permease [Paenibacillus thalictri]|uniref:Sugar ABC transporter permease n=1 Tax=Paenibacillus thalictri TaxID=2527873 RepID=A0A4Q9DJM0_9BACL|nr:ABC transporter permease subunit [Paenibacillus thalictri]TBL73231.1 sugar ABC transporter permease [Paenibacillus thalictri]